MRGRLWKTSWAEHALGWCLQYATCLPMTLMSEHTSRWVRVFGCVAYAVWFVCIGIWTLPFVVMLMALDMFIVLVWWPQDDQDPFYDKP